jgi:hypothetical protein
VSSEFLSISRSPWPPQFNFQLTYGVQILFETGSLHKRNSLCNYSGFIKALGIDGREACDRQIRQEKSAVLLSEDTGRLTEGKNAKRVNCK